MTRAEATGCISLMTLLWNNYKPPANDAEFDALVNAWLVFFSGVDVSEVTHAIHAIAAEGGDFAPQLGQIYKAVKDAHTPKRAAPRGGPKYDEAYGLCCLYAEYCDKTAPMYGDDLGAWATENVRPAHG